MYTSKKKVHICSLCPLRPRGGELKTLTDMSANNVSFSWTAPLTPKDIFFSLRKYENNASNKRENSVRKGEELHPVSWSQKILHQYILKNKIWIFWNNNHYSFESKGFSSDHSGSFQKCRVPMHFSRTIFFFYFTFLFST